MPTDLCKIVFVIGPPGSGKSSISHAFAEEFGYQLISPGDWLRRMREKGTDLGEFINNNYNYDTLDPLVSEMVKRNVEFFIETEEPVIIEGFPRTAYQAQLLPRICKCEPFTVVYLCGVTLELAKLRLLKHTVIEESKWITEDDVEQRYKTWKRQSKDIFTVLNTWQVVREFDSSQETTFLLTDIKNILEDSGVLVPFTDIETPLKPQGIFKLATTFETGKTIQRTISWSESRSTHKRFVGTHPISLERSHIQNIYKHPYVVSRKADGTRAMMIVSEGRVWLMLRTLQVWKSVWSRKCLDWEGTLMDVELMGGAEQCIVIDCITVRGRNLIHTPILGRMNMITGIFPCLSDMFPKGTSPQQYFSQPDLRCMLLLKSSLETDGIVFTPLSLPYRHGIDLNMFKWKPPEKNTVDLQFLNGQLFTIDNGKLCCFGQLVDPPKWVQNNIILECTAVDLNASQTEGYKWRVMKRRTDKNTPNADWTARRICVTIRENITLEQLLQLNGTR